MMDTIAALATAPFKAALGVIRMSGPQAFSIAEKVLKRGEGEIVPQGQRRNLFFARIYDGENVIDEGVICSFRGPFSYTGEDTVEFSCHGGVYLLDRVLRLLFRLGARQAEAGEFTKRAFLNGKSDLTRAEGVMDLIEAEYSAAAKAAMSELDGTVGKAILEINEQLLAIASKLLAYVDYPDDEIGEVSSEEIKEGLDACLQSVAALCGSYDTGRILRDGVKTVLCGRPNVGKSSLMNYLSGEECSIVTDIAGTTRDTVRESVVFGGCKLLLSDTAGIRSASDMVEKLGVARARKEMNRAGLIFCVFGTELTEEDRILAEEALQCSGKTVFLFNKSDLCPERELPSWGTKAPAFRVSAVTGEGMSRVEDAVREIFSTDLPAGSPVISNGRQYQCLCRVRTALMRAKENLGLTPDVIVSDLEEGISSVGEITGSTVSEAVIHEIFSRFCVGK